MMVQKYEKYGNNTSIKLKKILVNTNALILWEFILMVHTELSKQNSSTFQVLFKDFFSIFKDYKIAFVAALLLQHIANKLLTNKLIQITVTKDE